MVAHVFLIGPSLQAAPVELAQVAQAGALFLVAQHVHALIGVKLVGNILNAEFGFQQVVVPAGGNAQGLVAALVGGGAHLVPGQVMARAAAGEEILEFPARLVIVGFAGGAPVGQGQALGGQGGGGVYSVGMAVGAVIGPQFSLGEQFVGGRGKFRPLAVGDDGAANAVAPHAHRGEARIDL